MSRNLTVQEGIWRFENVKTVRGLVKISILSVLAYMIMFIEFPMFFFPGFLKIDFSDLPALIGGLTLGPAAGVMIELVKNILHFITKTTTGGVGEFANFLIGCALIVPSAMIYAKHKTKKSAMIGMGLGIIIMSLVGGVANYTLLLPFYAKFMPIEQIIAISQVANSAIKDFKTLVWYGVIPFNLLKGCMVALLTAVMYKKISPLLRQR